MAWTARQKARRKKLAPAAARGRWFEAMLPLRPSSFLKAAAGLLIFGHLALVAGLGGWAMLRERPVLVDVRIGERVRDWCKRLASRGITDCPSVREVALKEKFPADLNFVPAPRPDANRFEGLFRPGVYYINLPGHTRVFGGDVRIARLIITRLLRAGADRFANLGTVRGLSPRQQVILASIVEKEAASNRDYRRVSGVFHRRLKWDGPLGSCPTVEYALGFHRPFLKKKDLQIESPYNAYYYKGLPPTPIAFFSDQALAAARNPVIEEINFFVFDWTTGRLHFARYYEDHQANARRARANYIRKHGREAVFRKYVGGFYGLY